MEFIALDNQPFSVVGDVGFHRLVEHGIHYQVYYLSDVALLELHSNTVIASLLLASRHTYYGTPFGSLHVNLTHQITQFNPLNKFFISHVNYSSVIECRMFWICTCKPSATTTISSTVKVQKSLHTSKHRPGTMCLQYRVGNKTLFVNPQLLGT